MSPDSIRSTLKAVFGTKQNRSTKRSEATDGPNDGGLSNCSIPDGGSDTQAPEIAAMLRLAGYGSLDPESDSDPEAEAQAQGSICSTEDKASGAAGGGNAQSGMLLSSAEERAATTLLGMMKQSTYALCEANKTARPIVSALKAKAEDEIEKSRSMGPNGDGHSFEAATSWLVLVDAGIRMNVKLANQQLKPIDNASRYLGISLDTAGWSDWSDRGTRPLLPSTAPDEQRGQKVADDGGYSVFTVDTSRPPSTMSEDIAPDDRTTPSGFDPQSLSFATCNVIAEPLLLLEHSNIYGGINSERVSSEFYRNFVQSIKDPAGVENLTLRTDLAQVRKSLRAIRDAGELQEKALRSVRGVLEEVWNNKGKQDAPGEAQDL